MTDSWRTCPSCIETFWTDPQVPGLLAAAGRLQDARGVPGEETMGVVFRRIHRARRHDSPGAKKT